MPVPAQPKIYHIVHVDRLDSILGSNGLLCDAQIVAQNAAGTTIGMNTIKQRRLTELTLDSHPDLYVGHLRCQMQVRTTLKIEVIWLSYMS